MTTTMTKGRHQAPTSNPRKASAPPRRTGSLLRALGALAVLALVLAAIPVGLTHLARALPIDVGALTPGALARPDDGSLLILILLGVAWLAWAALAASIAVEVWAAIRRVRTPGLPGLGGPQRLASVLVALVIVGLAPSGAQAQASAPSMALDPSHLSGGTLSTLVTTDAQRGADDGLTEALDHPQGADPAEQPTTACLPTVTTKRHDTLWHLAERHLGSGERFTDIAALNLGVAQPDGRSLGDDGRLYPGWVLQLPADAVADPAAHDDHVVHRGETLWGIAEEELGDPSRFQEIFDANEGDLQPDGRRLADADLIVPGWVLEVPGADGQVAPGSSADLVAECSEPSGAAASSAAGEPAGEVDSDEALDGAALTGPMSDAETPTSAGSSTDDPTPPGGRPAHRSSDSAGQTGAPQTGAAETPSAEGSTRDGVPLDDAGDGELPEIDRASIVPDSAIPIPTGGLLGTLLLAGLAGELARRRRQFQRHRRPGERMPVPPPTARAIEDVARVAAAEACPDLLERALGQLVRVAREEGRDLPGIRVIRVGDQCVQLDLARPHDAAAISPFVAEDGTRWTLDPTLLGPVAEAEDLPALPGGLLTVGMWEEQTILVDLAEVGTLVIDGSHDTLPSVLRAMASEVALGPSRRTARTLCLSDDALSAAVRSAMEAGDIAIERDPERVAVCLRAALRNGPQDAWEGDPLELVLADIALPIDVPGRSGAALVTTDFAAAAGTRLELRPDGTAILHPDGLTLVPQRLSASATHDLFETLRATEVPSTDPADSTHPPDPADSTHPPDPADSTHPADPAALEVAATPSWAGRDAVPARTPAEPAEGPVVPFELAADGGALGWDGAAIASPEGSEQPLPASRRSPLAVVPSTPVEVAAGASVADEAVSAMGGAMASTEEVPASNAPHVLLLGEVRVLNAAGRAESSRINRLGETAAFVLLNPDARPSELQSALWPGRRSNSQTCRQMISRTRTWLGRTEEGEAYLMPFAQTGGRLRLRAEVGSDWAEFQRLATTGLADPSATASLAAALRLVRGRPFGSVAARELPWADLVVNEMICAITDVAHELAVRYERQGRWAAAREAALRGLLTECESEVLEAIVARLGRTA